jgi:hypothetical protein
MPDRRNRCKNKNDAKDSGERGENKALIVHYASKFTCRKFKYWMPRVQSQSTIFGRERFESTGARTNSERISLSPKMATRYFLILGTSGFIVTSLRLKYSH